MARSRVRPPTINRVLIDQTWFGRSGGLAPINLTLFQGVRRQELERLLSSGMGRAPQFLRARACAATIDRVCFQWLAVIAVAVGCPRSATNDPQRSIAGLTGLTHFAAELSSLTISFLWADSRCT